MAKLVPRPFQREAVDALYSYWAHGGGNGLLVIPTGGGKSFILALICMELLERYPHMRIGIVTDVKELIAQNAAELIGVWQQAPVGIYSAGLGRRDLRSRILFMGIQSVHSKVELLGKFDLLLIDEAHMIPRKSDTMYGRFIASCREIYPKMRVVGLTATPYRLDSGRLDRGEGRLFDDVVYEAFVGDLILDGYLSPLIGIPTLAKINTEGLHRRDGDFIKSEMDERARIPSVVEMAVNEIVELGANRAGWLAFCTSIEHANEVRDQIRKHGFSCESVHSKTPGRDRIIRQYKARQIRCLTSVGVLTKGFNAPHIDLLAMLRPTLSTGLYVQMVGRAFRLAEGKSDALILDFAGNVSRHGPVDAVSPQRDGGGGPAPKDKDEVAEGEAALSAKECPDCKSLVPLHEQKCACGHEWPMAPARHEARALNVAILSSELAEQEWHEVTDVEFSQHNKFGMPPSLRVNYIVAGGQTYSKWVFFEGRGRARAEAETWWKRYGANHPVPNTVAEALTRKGELRGTTHVRLKPPEPGQKHPQIVSARLVPRQLEAAE